MLFHSKPSNAVTELSSLKLGTEELINNDTH